MRKRNGPETRLLVPGLMAIALIVGCASAPTGKPQVAQPARVVDKASDVRPSSVVDEAAVAKEGPPSELAVAPEESRIERAAREVESREVKVVETTAQAEKYLTEDQLRAARRECMRKLRRVTGSRIPRNACQGSMGLFPSGFNQVQENNNPRGAAPPD